MRIVGIIIKDGKIILLHRIKDGREYYVFPGGGMEKGETEKDTIKREIKEELSLDIIDFKKIFEIENQGNKEVYYLITEFNGHLQLGGPEKNRMNKNDQYIIEWIELSKIKEIDNLYPKEAVLKLLDFYT
jgi:8-oxo-dGTP diphosphatase